MARGRQAPVLFVCQRSPAESRVFDRFYRVGGGERGAGLGLATVAAIVSAHDGRYGVDSVPGQGSTFWVELGLRR